MKIMEKAVLRYYYPAGGKCVTYSALLTGDHGAKRSSGEANGLGIGAINGVCTILKQLLTV